MSSGARLPVRIHVFCELPLSGSAPPRSLVWKVLRLRSFWVFIFSAVYWCNQYLVSVMQTHFTTLGTKSARYRQSLPGFYLKDLLLLIVAVNKMSFLLPGYSSAPLLISFVHWSLSIKSKWCFFWRHINFGYISQSVSQSPVFASVHSLSSLVATSWCRVYDGLPTRPGSTECRMSSTLNAPSKHRGSQLWRSPVCMRLFRQLVLYQSTLRNLHRSCRTNTSMEFRRYSTVQGPGYVSKMWSKLLETSSDWLVRSVRLM